MLKITFSNFTESNFELGPVWSKLMGRSVFQMKWSISNPALSAARLHLRPSVVPGLALGVAGRGPKAGHLLLQGCPWKVTVLCFVFYFTEMLLFL